MTVKVFGWKPPQRPTWVKELMKTPGYVRVQIVLLTILMLSSVTSTIFQISTQEKNVINITGQLELKRDD